MFYYKNMIFQIIITLLGWLVLMVVGTNLIGMLVRGLVLVSDVDNQLSKADDAFKKVAKEVYDPKVEKRVNFIAFALIIIYLIALFYFWNIGVVIAAIILMVARIPDLLWEIKHGRRSMKNMPVRYMLTLLIMFAAFPILWYALYQL